jgi:hypothetical protein
MHTPKCCPSVRPDLVRYLLRDGWTDLAQNWRGHPKHVAIGFARKKNRKKRFLDFALRFFAFFPFFSSFFSKGMFRTALLFETTLSPSHTPKKRIVCALRAILCFEFPDSQNCTPQL